MEMKTKLWVAVSVSATLLAGAGSAFAATSSSSQAANQTAQVSQQNGQTHAEGHHEDGGLSKNTQLLSLLKIDAATLQKDLKAGQSLADIAAAQKVDEQQVIDLLTSQFKQRIASEVQAGKLTQAQADQKSAGFAQKAKQLVEHKGAWGKQGNHEGKGFFNNAQLLSLLKIDAATLKNDLKAGQSLADIAAAQKVDEQQVIDLLTSQFKQRIASEVQSGKLTQAQADQKSADFAQKAKQFVEHKGAWGKEGKKNERSESNGTNGSGTSGANQQNQGATPSNS